MTHARHWRYYYYFYYCHIYGKNKRDILLTLTHTLYLSGQILDGLMLRLLDNDFFFRGGGKFVRREGDYTGTGDYLIFFHTYYILFISLREAKKGIKQ
jgi:hypothetical protein